MLNIVKNNMTVIIDLNLWNLGSIQNMLNKVGYRSITSNDKKKL